MLPDSLDLPNGAATLTWRRSARARRISLRIDPRRGGVVVTMPPRASAASAHRVLQAHRLWVAERLASLPAAVALGPGAMVPIDGEPHRIVHHQGRRGTAWIEPGELHVAGEPEFLARRVGDWLRGQARLRLGGLALAKARAADLPARRVVIKDTATRWGSCTAKGVLMFSWRLVMAPPEVQDYVVGHEVAHLRHMNHGPEFWALAATLTPHRAFATGWLDRNGAGLMRVG